MYLTVSLLSTGYCQQNPVLRPSSPSPSGFLASVMTSDVPFCSGRPWVITSARGQQINLTVYDFTVNLGSGGQLLDDLDSKHGVGMTPCRQYAVVEDAGRDVTLCGGFRGRFGSTYLSTGFTVKLWMTAGQAQNQLHRFLVHYRSELVKRQLET